ncbi:Eco57I restriction-modification methylase domain-containing protein [Gemmatimonas sp.]|uniref:Eco57I restriction-modification methylase domain-containing protein n=1 Tax=Gemmatimonas sp. TaxID=1962908 RepID=UPI003DA6555C
MARRNTAQIQFDALSLEGAILPPEWLARVAALEAPAQSAADYGIPKGLQLRDEIGRYWRVAQAVWADFVAARRGNDVDGAARRLTREMLTQVFGFADLAAAGERNAGGRVFPLAFEALGGRVPVVVGPSTESLDQNAVRHGDGTRRRSAWGALQEYLNAADGALWGFATNGLCVRLGRDNASLTRPAWLEADLERIFTEERFADFSVLWLLFHASRFGRPGQPVHEAPLEQWREAGRQDGSRAREALRVGVEDALRALGQGFLAHPENGALREALATGALAPTDYFNELLRLVYRMIFLLTVEERGILHQTDADPDAVTLYREGYGMRRLRERSVRYAAHDRHADLWKSLRPVFGALGNADGEAALALPGLGGLFGPDQCPHLDASSLENRALLTAVFRLAWLREGDALARVNWKDMGVEEFGSVYESLLELVPVVSEAGRRFGFAGEGESAGNARKLTGSYYTPDSLVQQLLDTALEPVVAQRLAEHADSKEAERALLSLAVVDPACGSGHFLLAAARRLAGHLARLRAGGTPGAAEYRHALRDVVTHCIHGVDRNPMALELARMALWLEAYTPDRALGFLDHHLVCGDALLGLLDLGAVKDGIPDEAFKALTGDDKDIAKLLTKLNRSGRKTLEEQRKRQDFGLALGTRSLGDAWAALDALSDDGLAGVDAKRAAYARLRAEAESDPRTLAADLFVGAFLMPKALAEGERALTEAGARARFPSTSALVSVLDGTMSLEHTVVQAARRACAVASVLHWPLAFPQVFARGGFDVVLGNPPWEVSQFGEEEFFAVRAPQVAQARNKAAREREIARLQGAEQGSPERRAYDEYAAARHLSEAVNVAYRGNPRFGLTAVGKMNTYPLFAETMYRMVSRAGRAGIIVPTGIATDDTTKAFFAEIAEGGRLVSLYDFENREGLFPSVHRSYKFAALTVGTAPDAEFAFYAAQVHELRDERRRFRLAPADFRLLNPNTRTCPIFRTAHDAELTKAIYRRVPVLIDERGRDEATNVWQLSFAQGLFNMASDSGLFVDAPVPGALPLYEAKMIHQFEHRWATYDTPRAGAAPDSRALTGAERADSNFSVRPRYWVDGGEVAERLDARGWTRDWLIGWRDICRATDERTTIVGLMPRVGVGHTMPLLIAPDREPAEMACLMANLNALVLDYVARQKVGGTHLTYGFLKQFPLLAPEMYGVAAHEFVVPRVLELTYTACDLLPWARDLGYDGPPSRWDPDRRALVRAELDAWYAHAYGLTRDELRYVLDPADVMGPDWPSETFRVLKNNEERHFGEYRTRRLVLEAWDRLFGG